MTDPLPLPPCDPGGTDPTEVTASIHAWVASPAMTELVSLFGGSASTLDGVAEFSRAWDFRAGVRERFDTARIDYAPDLDARLRTLIHTLGLGGAAKPAHAFYDHIIVLGGGIRVTLGRADYTARLLSGGLRAGEIAGLGSLRWRDDREHREGIRLGLPAFDTEADMLTVSLRRFLNLPDPSLVRTGPDWWHKSWAEGVHVLAAASTRPPRRANTADTLLGWSTEVHTPTPAERVLLVTNDPYVRHQHCDAVRLLGSRYECGIETIGFDDLTMREWGRPLSTTELLQEVRSSVLAMRNLHNALTPS